MKQSILVLAIIALLLAGCTAADTASYNLSKSADSFEITQRFTVHSDIERQDDKWTPEVQE